jgi:5-methylcytosine-specific restriction protein A
MISIDEVLREVLEKYPAARHEPFTDHLLGKNVRGPFAQSVQGVVGDSFRVKGSVGNGNWAETPWIAIFDPKITTSARRGYYAVYLFDQAGRHCYLSLNQATTEVKEEFGAKYREVLEDRAAVAKSALASSGISDLFQGPLDLLGSGDLTKGYCAGNIVAIKYPKKAVPGHTDLVVDLLRMLSLCGVYSMLRSGEVGQVEELPETVEPGIEAKKFRWHRRAERNAKLATAAKAYHGTTCQVCSFNFEQVYGERGAGYIEAHHIVPFAQLAAELEPVKLDPKTDFAVVCANCHRMLHRSKPALTPDELKALLL